LSAGAKLPLFPRSPNRPNVPSATAQTVFKFIQEKEVVILSVPIPIGMRRTSIENEKEMLKPQLPFFPLFAPLL
jgi:hypothetical protein